MGKHASLGICVRGNKKLGETHIPETPVPQLILEPLSVELLLPIKKLLPPEGLLWH